MSGQIDSQVCVRIVYRDPWTDDDARRLIEGPMADEMHRACEEIAARHSNGRVQITCV